jgi:hypothetical protein
MINQVLKAFETPCVAQAYLNACKGMQHKESSVYNHTS